MNEITKKLSSLKLAGIARNLEIRNRYAIESNLSYIDFLNVLIEDELTNRKTNSYVKRFTKSKLSSSKTIDSYDFTYQPKLNKKEMLDLASCRFIQEHENIIFMGNPGVGKTHLANAIGVEAIKMGYGAYLIHASELIQKLVSKKADGTYYSFLKEMLRYNLLIIDEIGFKKISPSFADEFFEIIRNRYENGSVIITTNRPFEEWGNIFGDVVLASAIIDRLVHHSHIIKITGGSYRTKGLINSKENG